jgi:hypothetical protein
LARGSFIPELAMNAQLAPQEPPISDEHREQLIENARLSLMQAQTADEQRLWADIMKGLISRRSAEQIEKMEREKSLR